jgi:hypothetical protein
MKKASESQEPRKKKTHTHTHTNKDQELLHQKLDWTPQISDCGWVESACLSECVSAKIGDAKLCDLVVSRAREKKRTTLGKRGDGGKTPATTTTNVGGQRRRGSDEGGRVGGR